MDSTQLLQVINQIVTMQQYQAQLVKMSSDVLTQTAANAKVAAYQDAINLLMPFLVGNNPSNSG